MKDRPFLQKGSVFLKNNLSFPMHKIGSNKDEKREDIGPLILSEFLENCINT